MNSETLPKTSKLYLEDTFLFEFDGTVLASRRLGTDRIEVALDRTAFYVESGGQPSDGGRLGAVAVLGVRDMDGVVWHELEDSAPAPAPGSVLGGVVDSVRRLDHMQQHTGQHILSQAFVQAGGRRTESFHLGREECTIDLSGPRPDADSLAGAVWMANECVLADHPIRVHQVERSALARYPLRKDAVADGEILRLIEIEAYDWTACGGTHASRSGQVGPIHILGVEKYKTLWRVRFVAGRRALRILFETYRVAQEVALAHSIRWDHLPETARAWQADAKAGWKEARRLLQELNTREGERLYRETPADDHGVRRLRRWFGPSSPEELRARAAAFAAGGPAVALFGGSDGVRAHWVAARSADWPGSDAERPDAESASERLHAWMTKMEGKGGGSPVFAQGTSRLPSEEEIAELNG